MSIRIAWIESSQYSNRKGEENASLGCRGFRKSHRYSKKVKVSLPKPTNINDLSINSENEFATLISVDLNDYLKDVQLDKKTIKIPHWLNVRATNEGINFSKTMSEALVQKLNI